MILRPELIPASISGDLRRGGWLVNGLVDGDTDAVSPGLNWLIDGKSLASYVDPNWREALNVHVLAQPDFSFDRYGSRADFQAGTVDALLRGESVQDISFATVASPANSHEDTDWNFGKVITHLLQSHCNYIYDADGSNGSPDGVVTLTDIDITDSTALEVFIVKESKNLWSVLQNIGGGDQGGEFYVIYCNRQNKIIYQPHPAFISPLPAAKGTLTKSHIRGTVRVQFNNSQPGEKVGQVQLMCVKNSTTVYSSVYPANPVGNGKIYQKKSGVWANSQARANVEAEHLYKWLTRPYTLQVEVDAGLVLFGDDGRGLDLGDRLLVNHDGPTEDAVTGAGVHLNLSAASFFVYGVDVRPDPAKGRATATLTLEADNS